MYGKLWINNKLAAKGINLKSDFGLKGQKQSQTFISEESK